MRSEKEFMKLILDTANADDRIRAAWIEGSRCNPSAPKDIFQDYDIEFIVSETESFQQDITWIDRFGERLYMQYPENSELYGSDVHNCYGWLIQFADGIRLDLHVCTLEHVKGAFDSDYMYQVLLDKDNCLPKRSMTELSDREFWVQKPSEKLFQCVCNEYWWCLNNVAKGLWRNEIPYAQDMLNKIVRPQLVSVLSYVIGEDNDYKVCIGKSGKYMYRYLPETWWNRFLSTYCGGNTEEIWNSVFIMCDLFDEAALCTAEKLGYTYDTVEAHNSRAYLEHVRKLPQDATEVY